MKELRKGSYIAFDIFFICFFTVIFILTLLDYRAIAFYLHTIFIFLGFAFLYSKRLKDLSIIEKTLYWISQNVAVPRTRYNHILGGAFFLIVGMLSFVFPPAQGGKEADKLLWSSLEKDPSFWVSIIFVLALNLLIGFYRSKGRDKGVRSQGKR